MTNVPPFILPLFRAAPDSGTSEFLGTGIVVASDCVLTCAHVVSERDGYGSISKTPIRTVVIRNSAEGRLVRCRVIYYSPDRDLALLKPIDPLNLPEPLSFLSDITSQHVARFRQFPWYIFGYAPECSDASLRQYNVVPLLHGTHVASDKVADIQVPGGIPQGFSGSPVLLRLSDSTWVGLGVVYLGGKQAATSRVLPADPILEFLRDKVRHAPFPASEAIPMLAQVSTQANPLKRSKQSVKTETNGLSDGTSANIEDTSTHSISAVFEGVIKDDKCSYITFSVFNQSPSLIILSDVVVIPFYFTSISPPGAERTLHSPLRVIRNHLRFTVSQAKIAAPREPVSFDLSASDSTVTRLSLLGPMMAVHLSPRSAESFSLTVSDDTSVSIGFVCMYEVVVTVSSPSNAYVSEVGLMTVFEVFREPWQTCLDVLYHPADSLAAFQYLLRNQTQKHAWTLMLDEMTKRQSSVVFICHILCMLTENFLEEEDVCRILAILRGTVLSGSEFQRSAWIRSLLTITPSVPRTLMNDNAELWKRALSLADPTQSHSDTEQAIRAVELLTGKQFYQPRPFSALFGALALFSLIVATGMWINTGVDSPIAVLLEIITVMLLFAPPSIILWHLDTRKLIAARREAIESLEAMTR